MSRVKIMGDLHKVVDHMCRTAPVLATSRWVQDPIGGALTCYYNRFKEDFKNASRNKNYESIMELIRKYEGKVVGMEKIVFSDPPYNVIGWRRVKSRSREGQFSYQNISTGERVADPPMYQARAEPGKSRDWRQQSGNEKTASFGHSSSVRDVEGRTRQERYERKMRLGDMMERSMEERDAELQNLSKCTPTDFCASSSGLPMNMPCRVGKSKIDDGATAEAYCNGQANKISVGQRGYMTKF